MRIRDIAAYVSGIIGLILVVSLIVADAMTKTGIALAVASFWWLWVIALVLLIVPGVYLSNRID